MGIFYQEESPNKSKKCKLLIETLKDVLCSCHVYGHRLSTSSPDEDTTSDLDEVVSEIRSRAIEKLRNKTIIITDSYSWVFSPKTGELFLNRSNIHHKNSNLKNKSDDNEDDAEREEYFSVASCLSCCSSVVSKEAFFSARTNFSCSERSFDVVGIEFQEFPKLSVIQEFCHCEGWPFGLGRKAILLPPLPKSPSESWTWRKGIKIVKMHIV